MHTYIVCRYDSLRSIAQQFGTTYQDIMAANQLTNFDLHIGQQLLIPNTQIDTYHSSQPELVWAVATDDTDEYPIAQIPEANDLPAHSQRSEVSERGIGTTNYTVKAGDNLSKIAAIYKTTPDEIKKINKLTTNVIWIGQVLKVPSTAASNSSSPTPPKPPVSSNTNKKTYTVKSGDTLSNIAWIFGVTIEDIKKENNLKTTALMIGQVLVIPTKAGENANTTLPPPANTNNNNNQTPIYYTVKAGDGLWAIATANKISIGDLLKWNKFANTNAKISPGQRLIVGYKSATSNPPPTNNNNTPPVTPPPATTVFTSKAADKVSLKSLSPSYKRIRLTDSVGQGGRNLVADVLAVQKILVQLEFLSATDFDKEQPKTNTGSVASNAMPQTIVALQRFNQIVADEDNDDEPVKPNSSTLQFMNNAALPLTTAETALLETARTDIKIQETSGRLLLAEPLTTAVGATATGNMPNDVQKVQSALRLLGYDIPESEIPKPDAIEAISQNKLVKTIAAIRDFQYDRVKYWVGKTYLTGDTDYLTGIVNKNNTDLTFKILNDYTRYAISFTLANNQVVKLNFNNHTRSNYTVDLAGISFIGDVEPTVLGFSEYEKIGLNTDQARALKYVSEHEGKFDAINSYDRALFSYGFIQFAGGNRGLAPTIALYKHLYPNAFAQQFERYGIDVEYSIANGDIQKAQLAVFDPRVQRWLRRISAETLLKNDKRLTALFIRAAYDTNMQQAQIESAVRRYVIPALDIKFSKHLKVGDKIVLTAGQPITLAIRSVKGVTALIDLSVNKWIVATRELFEDAIKVVAYADGLDTLEKLRTINETRVLRQIIKEGDDLAKKRIQSILDSPTLSDKK